MHALSFPLRILPAAALIGISSSYAGAQWLRGVNLAGAEFGEASLPGIEGRHYVFNGEPTFRYFASQGLTVMRIPFRWERLQPVPGGPLEGSNLAGLKRNVDFARRNGAAVILEPHNFGRYWMTDNGALREYIIDNAYGGVVKVSRANFADLWRRISEEFQDEPAVWAYDLVNEPHDMGVADWRAISQAAVDAVRARGDRKKILIPGLRYSNAHVWAEANGAEDWIADPANNIEYTAHMYFDQDFSGTYRQSYDQELARNPALADIGVARLAPFAAWCRANNVRGFLGEYGVPNTDPRWYDVMDRFLGALDAAAMGGAYWAAGEWWGNYALSIQPLNNYSVDRPQMEVLKRHLFTDTFVTVSSASAHGGTVAPGALVSGYGRDLDGARIEVRGADGQWRDGEIVAAAATQINYRLPVGLPEGPATVRVLREDREIAAGRIVVQRIAPALFTADRSGSGLPAAHLLRVQADGSRAYETLTTEGVAFAGETERLFLILWGTGFQNLGPSVRVRLDIGDVSVPVQYAGTANDFPGLDQVAVELPRSLAGKGDQRLRLRIDGRSANVVGLRIR